MLKIYEPFIIIIFVFIPPKIKDEKGKNGMRKFNIILF